MFEGLGLSWVTLSRSSGKTAAYGEANIDFSPTFVVLMSKLLNS